MNQTVIQSHLPPKINYEGQDWKNIKDELRSLIENETKQLVTQDLSIEQVHSVRGKIKMLTIIAGWEDKYRKAVAQQHQQQPIPPSY